MLGLPHFYTVTIYRTNTNNASFNDMFKATLYKSHYYSKIAQSK